MVEVYVAESLSAMKFETTYRPCERLSRRHIVRLSITKLHLDWHPPEYHSNHPTHYHQDFDTLRF